MCEKDSGPSFKWYEFGITMPTLPVCSSTHKQTWLIPLCVLIIVLSKYTDIWLFVWISTEMFSLMIYCILPLYLLVPSMASLCIPMLLLPYIVIIYFMNFMNLLFELSVVS